MRFNSSVYYLFLEAPRFTMRTDYGPDAVFLVFHFAVDIQRRLIHDALGNLRDIGRPFETHNSLTRSWNHLPYPLPVTVWFQYYREMEDFVRSTEGRTPMYIHGTVFFPLSVISYDHIRMEVYRMFYFNTPFRVFTFTSTIKFRLLFISSSTFGDQKRIERLFVTSNASDTLYHNGMVCET